MERKGPSSISESEWAVLEVLWTLRRAVVSDVTEALKDQRAWSRSTVKTILSRMAEKRLIQGRRVGNVWEYRPLVKQEAARQRAWDRFVGAAFGGSLFPALRFVAGDDRLTDEQRAELRDLLGEDEVRDD